MHPNEALFANEAFYLAFAQGDYLAMCELWSTSAQVVCIHPGWPALTGREAVLESWQGILGNSSEPAEEGSAQEQPRIRFYGAEAVTMGSGVAVICYEVLPGSVLTAMNLFVIEDQRPRLVHHQASPCAHPPPLDPGAVRLDG